MLITLAACNNNKDEKKTRPTGGVSAVDANTTAARQALQSQGTEIVVVGFNRINSGNSVEVQTTIRVGNDQKTIAIVHGGIGQSSTQGSGTVGGLQVSATSYCYDNECSIYTIMINALQNGRPYYQLGLMVQLDGSNQMVDGIYKIVTGNSMSFEDMRGTLYTAWEQ
jgi:hypothetical protein